MEPVDLEPITKRISSIRKKNPRLPDSMLDIPLDLRVVEQLIAELEQYR